MINLMLNLSVGTWNIPCKLEFRIDSVPETKTSY